MSEALTRAIEDYTQRYAALAQLHETISREHAAQRATIQQQTDTIAAHDTIKTKLEIKIQELTSKLAGKEVEIARLKDIIRREAWLEHAAEHDVPGPYVPWDDHCRELDELTATLAASEARVRKSQALENDLRWLVIELHEYHLYDVGVSPQDRDRVRRIISDLSPD